MMLLLLAFSIDISFSMAMIKLKLTLNDGEQVKMMVDLNAHQQLTVLDFLKRVVDISCISEHYTDLEMYDGEYLLPHLLPARYIEEGKLYKVTATKSKKSKVDDKRKQKANTDQTSRQVIITRKNKKVHQSSSSSSPVGNESVSSSSSNLQQFNKQNKTKKSKIDKKLLIASDKKVQTSKINDLKPELQPKAKPMSRTKPERRKKESSEQESESSITPVKPKIYEKKVQTKQSVEKVNKNQKQKSSKIASQSSEQEVDQPQKYKQKVAQILTGIKSSQKQPIVPLKVSTKTEKQQNQTKPATPVNIPISVRKKQAQPHSIANNTQEKQGVTFKQHQQMKWIPVTKQILIEWQKSSSAEPIVANGNQLRFKLVELDEQKFIPVSSGWITGYATKVESHDKMVTIHFASVTKASREESSAPQFIKQFSIPLHNMQQLQINKNTLNEKQASAIEHTNPKTAHEDKAIISNVQSQQKNKTVDEVEGKQKVNQKDQKQQAAKANQSVEEYVCGQINYYFGPKNYPSDLFMQMHANNNPQGNINLRLMLNFPKIKKVLTDEEKLWRFLTEDPMYSSRNYQLDFEKKMIRRKQ